MSQDFESLLMDLVKGGKASPELVKMISEAMNDPQRMEELTKILKDAGGMDIEEPLQIADYYREGDGRKYTKEYAIAYPLPVPFEELDRKTQFFTLFADWQRREAEGMMALTNGKLGEALSIFEECLERAKQIDVSELRARSYEGIMHVAERKNDLASIERYLAMARQARAEAR